MPSGCQHTLARPAELAGIGFFSGADIRVRFLPAAENHGLVFHRGDVSGAPHIPATIDFAPPRHRRTALERNGVAVEMVEHALAALSGLEIDNCLVEVHGPEMPGCDGSSQPYVDALLTAGTVAQSAPRLKAAVPCELQITSDDGMSEVAAVPLPSPSLVIGYVLDYGPGSPIPSQSLTMEITRESFLKGLSSARTFIAESEVKALRARGYGARTTSRDLLVFSGRGLIDNELRFRDECVRHKILDCLGDFALLGAPLSGRISAFRSGHELNRAAVRELRRVLTASGTQGIEHVKNWPTALPDGRRAA